MKILVDTNILVRINERGHPLQVLCSQVLTHLLKEGHELLGCAQAMIEFWAVATRPLAANGLGLTSAETEAALVKFEKLLVFLPEPADVGARWRSLANKHSIVGKQAHDTRLVAWMQAHSISSILTLNTKHFTRFSEVTCISPEELSLT